MKRNFNKTLISLGIILLFLGFLLSFTNKFPIYPILVLAGSILIVLFKVLYSKKINISPLVIPLYVLTTYFFFSAIASGVHVSQMLTYDFIRYDGNFIVAYAPLFLLLLTGTKPIVRLNMKKFLIVALTMATFVTSILVTSYVLHHPLGKVEPGIFFFLFKSHNAAGGYYLIISIIALGLFLFKTNLKWRLGLLFIFIVNSFALYLTSSRGSIIAFAVVLLILTIDLLKISKTLKRIAKTILIVLIIVLNLVLFKIGYMGWQEIGAPQQDYFKLRKVPPSAINLHLGRSHNVVSRLYYLWPRAIDDFSKSPILGIGFSRYNDTPYRLTPVFGKYIYFNTTENIINSSAHAHHSFLHILAETGIVGIVLTLIFIASLFKLINKVSYKPLRVALYYALIAILISSLTEHRLFAPAEILPFSTSLFIGIICNDKTKKHAK